MFLQTNEVHPGERHFYTMPVDGGARTKITSMTGSNDVTISPDERSLAVIHSYSTKPPELHIMPLTAGGHPTAPENLCSLCAPCHSDATVAERRNEPVPPFAPSKPYEPTVA